MGKAENRENDVGLKRELGLFSASSLIVTVMIGSGIFVSPSSALEKSGSVGFCLVVWTISGVLSLLCALTYAELSSVVPRSGAEYAYFMEAFGPLHRYFGQMPAFLSSWINVLILRPAEVAVVSMTFAEYLVDPFLSSLQGMDPNRAVQVKRLIALMALAIMVYVNSSSVKLYVKVQNVFTVCKIAACILVICGGVYWLALGNTQLLKDPFQGTTSSPGNVALAFYSGLWAYDGWNYAAIVTEEIKKPHVNILRSIVIAVPIITALYVAMNLTYMSALTIPEMVKSPAVAVSWSQKVLPQWMRFFIPLGVAISCFGCGLSLQFGVSRICYVAGREGHLPKFFGFVHVTKMTPVASVIFQGIISAACILAGDIVQLIELCSFLLWVFYGLAMVALLILRRTKPKARRPYKVPILVPWLVLAMALFLALMPLFSDPSPKYFLPLGFILVGAAFYHFYVWQDRSSVFYEKCTFLIQALCLLVEPDQSTSE